jgi:CBS domain-containing protein
MPRSMLVRQVMTPRDRVLAFHPDDRVEEAARAMAERGIGGAPVVDGDDRVVGMLSDDDLIVADARLHVPTVITVLGAYIELPGERSRFEQELHKAVGATVGEVMSRQPVTCRPDDTLEQVATVLHERGLSRLAVVDDGGKLVGIVSRGDLVRALIAGEG